MIPALLTSLRPHQWSKNLLVFAALGFSKHLLDLVPLLHACVAFLVFCGLSGAVYLVNDVVDLERDKRHPLKRQRPVASGALSARGALLAAALIALVSLGVALWLAGPFALCSGVYLGMNLLYSLRLKQVVIVEVLTLSLGFPLRAVAGSLAIAAPISDWLIVCTLLLALFLALAKRRHELTSLSTSAAEHRSSLSEYSPYLLDQMIGVVTASCVMAYCFYTLAPETTEKFQTTRLSWTIPFVLYGIFRYLYLVHQKEQGGNPSELLLTDRPLLVAVGVWAAATVLILYTAPGAPIPLSR
jgi:4-hydroxybenzoate polyprenyltransferase